MFAGLQLERFSVKKQNVPRSVCIPFYRVHKTRFAFVLFSCYSEYGSSSRVTALAWTGLFPRGFQSVPRGFLFFGDAFPLQTGHAAVRPRNKHGVFDSKMEHYGDKTSITENLRGLRGSYDCNPVILEDFGVSSLPHDFQLRPISYIPIDTRSPLSPRERGRFVLCASLHFRQKKF